MNKELDKLEEYLKRKGITSFIKQSKEIVNQEIKPCVASNDQLKVK